MQDSFLILLFIYDSGDQQWHTSVAIQGMESYYEVFVSFSNLASV
jgi:hypothetical protein